MKYTIIHSADWHFSAKHKADCLSSLDTMIRYGETHDVDLWIVAGDIFDHAIYNTLQSGLDELLARISRMNSSAPVAVVQGTPTHDVAGSYNVLKRIGVTMIEPTSIYCVYNGELGIDRFFPQSQPNIPPDTLILLGMSEPGRESMTAIRNGSRDDIDAEIIGAMQDLLTGFGAVRAQYPNNPCIFIYHGQIRGASLANGQILPGNGIAIGADDLALIGADYYALGDIHKGQQIGQMSAYYSGSAFPVDWGETDTKTYNHVTIDDPTVDIDLIEYGHPPRQKYMTMADGLSGVIADIRNMATMNAQKPDIWVEIRDKQEIISKINRSITEAKILDEAGLSSRVTFSAIPVQTIRSAEIQEVKTLYDKIKVWADLSEEHVPDDQAFLAMCERIESEAREIGDIQTAHRWRLSRAKIEGSIGIKKGTERDSIEIDFDGDYDPGLILLIGPNGGGKTSFIENLTPFPRMMTRSGKLQDHFYKRDSFRDLYYVDELNGQEYRFFITIAGGPGSGQNTYHIMKWDGQAFQPLPGITGRLADYEREIALLFGSFSMFVQSVFLAQEQPAGIPDIATVKGTNEKKAIFRELSGIDHYTRYMDIAKIHAKDLDEDITARGNHISGMVFALGDKDQIQKNRQTAIDQRAIIDLQIAECSAHKDNIGTQVDTLRKTVERNNVHRTTIGGLTENIVASDKVTGELIEKITALNKSVEAAPEARKMLEELSKLEMRKKDIEDAEYKIGKEKLSLSEDYIASRKIIDDQRAKIEVEIQVISRAIDLDKQNRAALKIEIARLEPTVKPITCPNCKTSFVLDADAEKLIAGKIERVKPMDAVIAEADTQLDALRIKYNGIKYPEEPEYPIFKDDLLLRQTREKIAVYDPEKLQKTITDAATAETEIKTAQETIVSHHKNSAEWLARRKAATAAIDIQAESIYTEQTNALAEVTKELITAREIFAAHNETINGYDKRLAEIEETEQTIKAARKENIRKGLIRDKWVFIVNACSPKGIQALELDALSPAIANTANTLLQAAYGSQFSLEIRTTKISGAGARAKQIETFDIIMIDSNGDEQNLDTLSGGEKVWCRKAIYDAFAIVRARNTGLQFSSVFLDEADGALDPDSTLMYFRMIEAAHTEGQRAHTFIISHSELAQQMIAQSIRLGTGE